MRTVTVGNARAPFFWISSASQLPRPKPRSPRFVPAFVLREQAQTKCDVGIDAACASRRKGLHTCNSTRERLTWSVTFDVSRVRR
jgi:hypothetical protein